MTYQQLMIKFALSKVRGLYAVVFAGISIIAFSALADSSANITTTEKLNLRPLEFTPNQGQWDSTVSFRAAAPGATLWFSGDGIYYQFARRKLDNTESRPTDITATLCNARSKETGEFEYIMLKSTFLGTYTHPEIRTEQETEHKCNYFIGNDSSRWRTDVPNFQSITYQNLYNGIDLKFYGNQSYMEYDFIVKPGADPSQISIEYEGATSMAVDSFGNLQIGTRWGRITEFSPNMYQQTASAKRSLLGKFVITGANRFGFEIFDEYDRSNPVVIDPTLTFSTYLGGTAIDFPSDIAVNISGQTYLTGTTFSTNFPTAGPYDANLNGSTDAFVTKVNASGTGLAFSTYLGGASTESGEGLDIASEGSAGILIVGHTNSTDFPMVTPLDNTANGGADIFITALSSTGNSLNFSTYWGGSNTEVGAGIVSSCASPCVGTYSVWVAGSTASSNFPTSNASQTTNAGGTDGFLVKLNHSTLFGYSVGFSTYYGGSLDDDVHGLALSPPNPFIAPYISGLTLFTDLPGVNGFSQTLSGTADAFITKFSIAGNGQVFPSAATFFGGPGFENGWDIAFLSASELISAGVTQSPGISTPGAADNTLGTQAAYVAGFSSTLASRTFCTYLSGSTTEDLVSNCLAIDRSKNVVICGMTFSSDFPWVGPYDSVLSGLDDAFIARVNSSGTDISFGTYLGGNDNEDGAVVAVDTSGCVYVSCHTLSSNFPVVNPYDGGLGGPGDGTLTKLCVPLCCQGMTGNVDCDPGEGVDISDLSTLIDNLYISFTPLCCPAEANTDGQPGIDIADLSALIDYLYISFTPPAACQ